MRPAVGTWCEDCFGRGHRCQAQLYVDGDASCLPCADGAPCSVERVAAATTKAAATEDMWGEPIPGPVKSMPDVMRGLVDNPKQDGPGRWRAALGPKITEELIAEAHAVPQDQIRIGPTIAHKALAVAPVAKPAPIDTPKRISARIGPLKPKQEKKPVINDEKKLTPEMEGQMRCDFLAGMTANAASKKHGVSWFVADKFRKQLRITPASQIKAKFAPPAPASVEEVFQEIFPAKPTAADPRIPTATMTANLVPPAPVTPIGCSRSWWCGGIEGHLGECKERIKVKPTVPTATVNGFEFTPPTMAPEDMCACLPGRICTCCWPKTEEGLREIRKKAHEVPAPRVSINLDLSEDDAVAMFSNLSVSHKADALRSVLTGLLRTS